MRNKQILLSGRAVTTNAANVPADRYSFLHLSDAEPNLGTASANGWVLVYDTSTPGNRLWSKNLITAYDHANSAYESQNTTGVYANASFLKSNSAYDSQNTTGTYANTAFLKANSAYASQNVTGTYANNAYDQANSAASYANSAFLKANSAYDSQNVTGTYANAAYAQANSASLYANGAFVEANAAYNSQNTTGVYANASFLKANSAYAQANSASLYANGAFIQANASYDSQNVTGTYANAAYAQANSASLYANGAFLRANASYESQNVTGTYANSSFLQANSSYAQANSASLYANGAFVEANAAYNSQNTTGVYANAAFLQANSAYAQANSASLYANGAFVEANSAYESQNVTGTYANAAYAQANSASLYANGSFIQANAAYESQNVTGTYANAAFLHANSAYGSQNTTGIYANSAYDSQNTTGVYANSAYVRANNSLDANSGGTVTGNVIVEGDLSITGNVFILGNTFSITTGSIVANDSLIILGANNFYADIVDIGFAGHYNDGVNAHSGIIRDATTKEWYLFKGYTPEVGPNNNIITSHSSFATDTLNANLRSNTVIIRSIEIGYFANASYNTANAAFVQSNASFLQANSTYAHSNSAYIHSNSAYDQANSAAQYANASFVQSNASFLHANSAYDSQNTTGVYANSSFLQANSAYASQNVTGTYANSAYDQANSAASYANSAYQQANSASLYANGAFVESNASFLHANAGFIHANAAFDYINTVSLVANTTNVIVIGISDQANAAFLKANSAYESQNVTGTYANNAYNQANSAAYRANNSLDANNGGSVTGTVSVTGNLIANYIIANSGFASTAGASKLQLTDIGLVVVDVAGQQFKFGGGGIESPLGIYGGSFGGNKLSLSNETNLISNRYDTVKIQTGTDGTVANEWVFGNTSLTAPGNITATGFIAGGINIAPYAIASFSVANSASLQANASFVKTNSAYQLANSAYDSQNTTGIYANSSYTHANAAFDAANNATDFYVRAHANASYNTANASFIQANAAFIQANAAVFSITVNVDQIYSNSSGGNVLIGLANVNSGIGTYGGASAIPVINVDGYGRVLSVSNTTISVPPGTYIFPNTNQLTANATSGNIRIGLANVNVDIGTYGNAFSIPTITIDGYGRITNVINTSISIPDGTYIVNSSLITSNSQSGNVVLSLAPSGVVPGIYGGAIQTPVITIDQFGRITAAINVGSSGGGSSTGLGTIFRNSFTATAAQTSFQTSSSFVSDYLDVYVNGLKLSPTDYVANQSTATVTILNPVLQDGDSVDIQASTSYVLSSNTAYSKTTYLATAGQYVFTIDYVPGSVNVYLNGLRLQSAIDYTASNGTQIVFPVALELNDVVEIEKLATATIYSQGTQFATRNTITVTANGDTTFIIGGGYRVNFVDIFVNGLKVNIPNDVVANNGSTIVFQETLLEVDDIIETVGIGPDYTPANAISIFGGSISGNLEASGTISAHRINCEIMVANTLFQYNNLNVSSLYFQDGTNMSTAAFGNGGSANWRIITGNTTATLGDGLFVDTTSANVYITLNASPYLGNTTRIVDMTGNFGINNCIIKGNGKKIMGSTQDLVISSNNAGIGLVYSNLTHGWRLIENL